ncbi:SCO3242 family prenyltransferase [Streptomyces sp. WY228]|uniref:SCO3242 family prenyltransferase n=1 Tax=Streptomyces sp. WY228 TaxID=2855836 RepID=UPI001C4EBFC8|nr:UbiA family prenyltransferase [Streptomyces sp. WY228]QXR00403.1 UbiA family prenyltransferase [Streptomyces sp. WY228]
MRRGGRAVPAALVAALSLLPAGRRNGSAHGGPPAAVTDDSLSGAGGTAPAPDRPGPPPTGRNGEQGAEDADASRSRAASGPDAEQGADQASGRASGRGADRASGQGAHQASGRSAPRQRLRAWAELLRVSALFSVPGDALAGAAAVGRRPGRGTALAIGASLCLYEAGMALNDWADREEDAVDRPHRPIPSGRISPAAALGAAGVLTAAGLALAARAGRPALTVATGLAATVWAYDLHLKHTKAGPAAMAAARSLDLLLGATATATGKVAASGTGTPAVGARFDNVAGRAARAGATPARASLISARGAAGPAPARGGAAPTPVLGGLTTCLPALPAAFVLGAHTYGVTAVSRHEAQGGSTGTPLAVLATTTALAAAVLGERWGRTLGLPGATVTASGAGPGTGAGPAGAPARGATARRTAVPGRATARGAGPQPGDTPGQDLLGQDLLGRGIPGRGLPGRATDPLRLLVVALTGAYLRTAGPPLLHAALNPSPPLTQRAVGGGIRAMIPLQAALAARAGAPVTGLAVMGLVPLARSLARKVSLT